MAASNPPPITFEGRESQLQIRGNPQPHFARKSDSGSASRENQPVESAQLLFSRFEELSDSPESELQPTQTNAYGAPLPPFDPKGAIAFLESLYEGDAEEQYETFDYLKRALNETRAANGERLLFLDE